MRVEALDQALAYQLAGQVDYLTLKKLNGKIPPNALSRTNGTRAAEENRTVGLDMHEVLKALNLSNHDNKFMILNLLRRWDLIELLYLLDKTLLINGLRFFDKKTLLRLILRLPKRLIIKMLRHLFSIDYLASKMPTAELIHIMRSEKLQNREMVKGFETMDVSMLRLLMSKITDQNHDNLSKEEILRILFRLNKIQMLNGLKQMPFKALTPLVGNLMKQNPDLLMDMSNVFLVRVLSNMSKPMMMQMFQVLPNDLIIEQFLKNLPDQFLLLTAAQIDTKQLEEYLMAKQPQLLALLGAAAA